jgi:hypothetical protein
MIFLVPLILIGPDTGVISWAPAVPGGQPLDPLYYNAVDECRIRNVIPGEEWRISGVEFLIDGHDEA